MALWSSQCEACKNKWEEKRQVEEWLSQKAELHQPNPTSLQLTQRTLESHSNQNFGSLKVLE